MQWSGLGALIILIFVSCDFLRLQTHVCQIQQRHRGSIASLLSQRIPKWLATHRTGIGNRPCPAATWL